MNTGAPIMGGVRRDMSPPTVKSGGDRYEILFVVSPPLLNTDRRHWVSLWWIISQKVKQSTQHTIALFYVVCVKKLKLNGSVCCQKSAVSSRQHVDPNFS